MNCQSVRDHLLDHWDQLNGGEVPQVLRSHLQECEPCRQHSAEVSLSRQLLQDLPEAEPTENFEWRLRLRLNQIDKEGVEAWAEPAQPSRRWRSLQFAGSAAAAALVVVAVGFLALRAPSSLTGTSAPGTELVQGADDAGVDADAAPAALAPTTVAQDETPAQVLWGQERPRLPKLAPSRPDFLQVVPVSSGVPFGPDPTAMPAPSIIGDAVSRPVLHSRPTLQPLPVANPR